MRLYVCQAPVDWDNTIVSLSLSLYTTCQYLGLCSFSNEAKINYWCWRGQEKALAHARHAVKSTQPPTKTKNKKQKKKRLRATITQGIEREREKLSRSGLLPPKPAYHITRERKRRVWVEMKSKREANMLLLGQLTDQVEIFIFFLSSFSFFLCVSCVFIGISPMTTTPQHLLSWDNKIEAIKRIVNGVLTPLTNDATRNLAVVKISKSKMKRKWRKKKELRKKKTINIY